MKNHETESTVLAQERTMLALERTFSAWLRTAIAAMAGGLAILRLITFKTDLHRIVAHVIGETLIFWGCLLIILSTIDYKKMSNKLVLAKNYKTSKIGFIIIVLPLLIMSTLLILVTLP